MGKLRNSHFSSDPTPGQLAELFRLIEAGEVTKETFWMIIHGGMKKPVFQLTGFEQQAASLLGSDKVLGFQRSACIWDLDLPEMGRATGFLDDTLVRCAEENKHGADWRLIWSNGLSIHEQYYACSSNLRSSPSLNPRLDRLFKDQANQDLFKATRAGYRLFDFSGRFFQMQWLEQEGEIQKLEGCRRALENEVLEACISIYLDHGEQVLKKWLHWGPGTLGKDSRISVGAFGSNLILEVEAHWDGNALGDHGVVLSKTF